jgi:hypothetical protein
VGLTLLKFRYSTYEARSSLVDEQSQFIACADWLDPKAASTKRDKFSPNLCRPKNVPVVSVFIAGIVSISAYHWPWNLYILIDLVVIFLSEDSEGQCVYIRVFSL